MLLKVFFIFLVSCQSMAHALEKIPVSVTILPQAYFVERLGGNHVDVRVMIPKGANPETYEPAPQQLISLSRTKIYVMIGGEAFPAEKKYLNILREKAARIDVIGFDNSIGNNDPHLWISISAVKALAKKISQALSRLDPIHSSDYKENLSVFLNDIEIAKQQIRAQLTGKKGKTFIVDHPVWGYFAAEFGLTQLAIEEEGKPVNASHLKKIVKLAREKTIHVIFVQKGFDARGARAVAREINARIIETDPLEKDWLQNMKNFAVILRENI